MRLAPGRGRRTHDWAGAVDFAHLALIRRDPAAFAPGGVGHLILEVAACAADEAERTSGGRCSVTLYRDGSVMVSDNGRGTEARPGGDGGAVRKPIMTSRDLRFFDHPGAQLLADGHPRRGVSIVAALSEWLVHTSRRREGAWSQRYEHGVPVSPLIQIAGDGSTGTAIHFLPDRSLRAAGSLSAGELVRLARRPGLSVEVDDRRAASGTTNLPQ
jgi:topoisomerase IV subunit B